MKTQKKTNKLCLFLSMVAFSVLLLAKPLTAQAALSAPNNIQQVSGKLTEIQVTWDLVQGANGYDLQYSADKVNWSTSNVLVVGNVAKISNLTANTTYYVQVATKESDGTAGTYSQILECNTAPEMTAANVPVVANATENSITVNLAPVAGAKSYTIYYKSSQYGVWKAVKKNVKGTSATVKYSKYSGVNYYYVQANSVSFKGKKVSSTNPNNIKYSYYMDSYRK